MKVPFLDLKLQYSYLKNEILEELNQVLDNTAYICGKRVKLFEENFAVQHNAKYFLGLSSGTDALHLTYWSLGIGISSQMKSAKLNCELDEVIVPVNTYIATTETITIAGAKPVFVDHEEESYNIDPYKIEERINSKTKAIVVVHLYGQPANMDPILDIAKKHNLILIEDCSQSHNAEYKGVKVGAFGNASTFSFYPGKNLGAYGEAGGVMTNDSILYQKMLRFRQHGAVIKYIHDIEGHNYRMEEIQGAVLNVKLKYLDQWTEGRRHVALKYNELLSSVDEIALPKEMPYAKHVYHLFEIRVKKRESLMTFLQEKGIDTGLHYPLPLHLQQAYQYLGHNQGDFPVAEKCCKEILSIPMFPEMSEEQIIYVCNNIKLFYSKR